MPRRVKKPSRRATPRRRKDATPNEGDPEEVQDIDATDEAVGGAGDAAVVGAPEGTSADTGSDEGEGADEGIPEDAVGDVESPAETADDRSAKQDETLASLYDVPETERDLSKLTRTRRHRLPGWAWVAIALGVLLAAAAAGFYVFTNAGSKFAADQFQADFEAPASVASGEHVPVTVRVTNASAATFEDIEFTLQLPDGAKVITADKTPTDSRPTTWSLDRVAAGATGELHLTMRFVGEVNQSVALAGTFSYRPANTSARFSHDTSKDITITASLLTLTFDGPLQVAPGTPVTYTVTVTNSSPEAIGEVELTLDLPDEFSITEVKPDAVERQRRWRFRALADEAKQAVTLKGSFSGEAQDLRELTASAGIVETGGSVTVQGDASLLVVLVNSTPTLTVTANGKVEAVADLGDRLEYELAVENTTELELKDVTLAFSVSGVAANVDLLAPKPDATTQQGIVTWTKKEVPGFASLKPGEKVSVTALLPVRASLVSESSVRNATIVGTATLKSPSLAAVSGADASVRVEQTTKLNADFRLAAVARYYDDSGQALGSGPLPPTVGQQTTYRVTWTVIDALNDVKDLLVTAALPDGVTWLESGNTADAGTLTYDAVSQTVSWSLNRIPGGSADQPTTLRAHFMVAVTPTSAQAGSLLVLVEKSSARVTDAFTNTVVRADSGSLSSDLASDPFATGKGVVISGQVNALEP